MAEEKGGGGSSLPVSALILALAALGILVAPKSPLRSDRPVLSRLHEAAPQEDVRARLWEDPFEAVLKDARERRSRSGARAGAHGSVPLKAEIPPLLKEQLAEEGPTILGVMTNGGPYAEDGEWRLRHRYAVVSALLRAGFLPWDERHIGSFYYDYGSSRSPGSKAPPTMEPPCPSGEPNMCCIVPYEVFWKQRTVPQKCKEVVLLVWINDHASLLDGRPLARVLEVIRLADPIVGTQASNPGPSESPPPRLKIIGPVGSTPLAAIWRELMAAEAELGNRNDSGEQARGVASTPTQESDGGSDAYAIHLSRGEVQFFSPTATAAEHDLREWSDLKNDPDSGSSAAPSLQEEFEEFGIRFYRTILTDEELAGALVDEVALRAHTGKKKMHVVLVGEKDTIYARSLADSFKKAFEDHSNGQQASDSKDPAPEFQTVYFSYLRGLDGRLPGDPQDEGAESEGNQEESKTDRSREDRPVGFGRFDYLERLADQIALYEKDAKENRDSAGVLAIGILGNDVYDKLLVIQALRQRFPLKLLFTTDVDTRLLYRDYRKWTRNTLAVSSFGLSLHPRIQGSVPPFRDSYQTSLFFTTLAALGTIGIENGRLIYAEQTDVDEPPESAVRFKTDRSCNAVSAAYAGNALSALQPQVYEIGRSSLVYLSSKAGAGSPDSGKQGVSIYGETGRGNRVLVDFIVEYLLVLLPLAFVLFCALSYQVQNVLFQLGNSKKIYLPAVALGAVLLVSAAWLTNHVSGIPREEPISFTEGISAWTTIWIHWIAFALSLVYLGIHYRRMNVNREAIETEEGMEASFPGKRADSVRKRSFDWKIFTGYLWQPTSNEKSVEPEPTEPSTSGKPSPSPPIEEPTAGREAIWSAYVRASESWLSLIRAVLLTAVYYLFMGILFREFHADNLLIRGDLTYTVYEWTGHVTRFLFFVLLFFAFDQAQNCARMVQLYTDLVRERSVQALRSETAPADNLDRDALDLAHLIAKRTECVSRLVLAPFFIWFLLILSRLRFFEGWDTGLLQTLARIIAGLICVMAAVTLRRSAKRFQQTLSDALDIHRRKAARHGNEEQAQRIASIREEVMQLRRGAFSSLLHLPIVQAVLWPFTGIGSLYLIDYLGEFF